MITEVLYYGFDYVPLELVVNGLQIYLMPCLDLKGQTGTKNVAEWIEYLSKLGKQRIECYGYSNGTVIMGVWNTGWGEYAFYGLK